MRRFGRLALLVMVVAVLSLCLILPVLADESVPIGITDTPTPTPTGEPEVPPVVPEASTLVLLGSSVTGLAAYVGLQIRARRNSS